MHASRTAGSTPAILADWRTGRCVLLGRSKTVIVCAGMKVFPEEVEELINSMPGVNESLVSGRDIRNMGRCPLRRLSCMETSATRRS